jgi:hypothetical protein
MLSGVVTEKSRQVLAGFFFVWLPAGLSVKSMAAALQHICPPDAFFMLQLSAY